MTTEATEKTDSSPSPVSANPTKKTMDWRVRNSHLIRGSNPPSSWTYDGQTRTTETDYLWEKVIPGMNMPNVKCKTFRFRDADPATEDGAVVAIMPGANTPVQYVASETTFSEIPLRGKLIFLSVSPKGELGRFFFDISEKNDSTHMAVVSKGWIMSWYACKANKQDGLLLETEKPGFSQSNLTTVEDNAKSIDETNIPQTFWETIDLLRNGHEEKVLPLCESIVNSK
jgi:hypothetical protein